LFLLERLLVLAGWLSAAAFFLLALEKLGETLSLHWMHCFVCKRSPHLFLLTTRAHTRRAVLSFSLPGKIKYGRPICTSGIMMAAFYFILRRVSME
jgi:hypothetical protein